MKIKHFSSSLLAVGLLIANNASATVLDFAGLGLSNWESIPQTYGDNTGTTPNVGVSYSVVDGSGNPHATESIEYWNTPQYGDLFDVAYSGANGWYAKITLTPDSGFDVILNSFDMAGYPQTNLALASLEVLSGSGAQLWDSGVTTILGAGPTHNSFSPNITSSGPISIVWGTNWNIGIDNINFSQRQTQGGIPVPEPTTLALLGLGLAGLGFRRKRRD